MIEIHTASPSSAFLACISFLLTLFLLGTESSKRTDPQFRYKVREEVPTGTVVCSLIDDIGHSYPAEVLHLLRFRFLAEPNPLFDIGPTTGVMTTADVIDRDAVTLCRQRELCEISVDVVIQPSQHFRMLKIVVEILDVNDNAPRFREPRISLPINEAAAVESAYIVPTATDFDSPANGVRRYELAAADPFPSTPRFGLQVNPKLDGTLEVKLVLKAKLDRETESEYHLRLMAHDSLGPGGKTGTLAVHVLVQDSNDNRPEFTRHQYEASVVENVPVGSTILQVTAVDRDAGPNGAVGYSFATQTQNVHGHLFGIDNRTGEILIRGGVDHEKSPVYQLVVIAQDHGPDMLSSEVTVIVHVDDVNDNPPSVTFHTLTSADDPVAEILESSAVGTFVAHISVHDPDSGRNGQVNCTIDNEKVFSLVQKYPADYQIVTATMLDRERTDAYQVTVRCHDGAPVPLVTDKMLRVLVTDENDNAPVFDRQQYVGTLRENNEPGTSVLQVAAADWDEGSNARIQYSLPAIAAAFFRVDQRGVISAHRPLDREVHDAFQFAVFAADTGSPSRTGSALVTISVEDVNDEAPRFGRHAFVFGVHENEPPGAAVGALTADDRDGPPFNNFLFALSSSDGGDGGDAFSVDPVTGTVSTQRELDRESRSQYQFRVTVYDPHVTAWMDTATVSVRVLDRNDNGPAFVFPSPSNNSVFVSSHSPPGRAVARVQATDADADENALVTYAVKDDRANNGTFKADADRVVLAKRLPAVDYRLYRITLVATDAGNPPKSTTEVLYVHVNQSIPFTEPVSGGGGGDDTDPAGAAAFSAYNLVVVVGVASGCSVVAFLLVVAIIVVRQKDKRRHVRKYNCRMEALRMLTTKEAQFCSSSPEGSPRKRMLNGSTPLICRSDQDTPEGKSVITSVPKITGTHPAVDGTAPAVPKSWHSSKDLEVHPCIHSKLNAADVDRDSVHSVEGSVTDSGRGPSEEGEAAGHIRHNRERFLPPPPPPPRGAYWLQQQKPSPPLSSSGPAAPNHPHHPPTVRFQGLSSTPEESESGPERTSAAAASSNSGVPIHREKPSLQQRTRFVRPSSSSAESPGPGVLAKTPSGAPNYDGGGVLRLQNRTGNNRLAPGQQQQQQPQKQQQATLDQLSRQRTTLDQLSRSDPIDPIARPPLSRDRKKFSRSRESVFVTPPSSLDRNTMPIGHDVVV